MHKEFPDRRTVEWLRREYPTGTRVRLLAMDDVQAPPVGTTGTVQGVDDAGHVLMSWDSGGSLNLIYGVDDFEKISTMSDKARD